MNLLLILEYFGCGLLGIVAHLAFFSIPEIRKLAKAANHPFSYKDVLKLEQDNIIKSVVAVILVLVGFGELADNFPIVLKWTVWIFIFVGFTGSVIIMAVFSKGTKQLLDVIDKKTNIADSVLPEESKPAKLADVESPDAPNSLIGKRPDDR